jgi:hypothetical protein
MLQSTRCYSLQENESWIAHPGGVREGSQGLRSNLWETHECADHPEGMRESDLFSHPFGMLAAVGTVPGVAAQPLATICNPFGAVINYSFS